MGSSGLRPHTGRRRNEAVRQAVVDATVEQLRSPDQSDLSIEGVARAAGVGKQTIYRWWPSRGALVAEALARYAATVVPLPDTGTVRGDLEAFFRDSFAALADPGTARGLRRMLSLGLADPHFATALGEFTAMRRKDLRSLLERGRERGELAPEANLGVLVDLGYGFLWYRFLTGHAPLDAAAAATLAEHLVMPRG
jgi:AcrR family transcriptional regulator